MPDSPLCVCVDVLDADICFGVAWWAAAVVTLSEPVSGALLLELALPSAKGSVLARGVPGSGAPARPSRTPGNGGFGAFRQAGTPQAGEAGTPSPKPGDPWPPTIARTLLSNKFIIHLKIVKI